MSRESADPDELALPEWIFTKHLPGVIERMRTEIGGGTFAAKIFKPSSSASASNKAPDAEVMDVTELLVPKKKKKATPKSKAKGKAKAVGTQGDDQENVDGVLADVQQSGGCTRKRWWIDDVLAALIHAAGHAAMQLSLVTSWISLRALVTTPASRCLCRCCVHVAQISVGGDVDTLMDPGNRRALKTALGLALEFVFHKSIIVHAKPKRVWSQVRPLIQEAIKKGLARTRAVVGDVGPEGVEALTKSLEKDALTASATTAGEKNILLWLTDSSAESVRKWLGVNASRNPSEHSAFCSAMNKLMGRLCKCRRDVHLCPVHAEASVTLSDLVWWAADAIFENVPSAVPSLSLAMTLKFSSTSTTGAVIAAATPGAVPGFCHFLCTRVPVDGDEPDAEHVWMPNNGALEVLIGMRPVYLLHLLLKTLTTLARSSKPCNLADVTPGKLIKVCKALAQDMDSAQAGQADADVAEQSKGPPLCLALETVVTTMMSDESEWAAAWGKLLAKCLQMADVDENELARRVSVMTLRDIALDVQPKFRHLLTGVSEPGPLRERVKAEALSPRPKAGVALNADGQAEGQGDSLGGAMVQLSQLYTFHPDPNADEWNVLDVLSLQAQVSAHMYARAFHSQIGD